MQFVVVFLLALATKLTYVHERLRLPDVNYPVLDSRFNDEWARGMAFGEWPKGVARLRDAPCFRAPLYTFFLAGIYRTAGTSPETLFTIQAILGALAVALLFVTCLIVFDWRVAWMAAALQILYWPFTYHEAERLYPALSLLLDIAFLLVLLLGSRRNEARYVVLAGILMGMSSITRPTILLTLPVAIWWLMRTHHATRASHVALFCLSVAVVIAPVTIRNWVYGHDFVPIASQGGVNFYIGNNPASDGVHAVVPGTRADWWGGFDDVTALAERKSGRRLRPSQVSRFWYWEGLEFWRNQPGAAARLCGRKLRLLLGNSEPSNERQLYYRRQHSRVLSLLVVNFAFILATALLGIIRLRVSSISRRPSMRLEGTVMALMAASCALGVVAFFVTSRFRLPVALFLIPLSAAGCIWLIDLARRGDWKHLAGMTCVGTAVFTASLSNPFGIGTLADSRGEYAVGVDHFHNGDYGLALEALNRSLECDPHFAPAWVMRGRSHDRAHDWKEAMTDLKMACSLDSTFADAFYWFGVELQKGADHASAEKAYLKCIGLDPTHFYAMTNLADIYFRQGRVEDARAALARALSLDSTYANALYGMGYYWEIKGETGRAMNAYRRAFPFGPARKGLTRLTHVAAERDSLR